MGLAAAGPDCVCPSDPICRSVFYPGKRRLMVLEEDMKQTLLKTSVLGILAGIAAWSVGAGPAQAEPNWTRMSSSSFPARVKSIEEPGGHPITREKSACWGKWCVGMGMALPVANYSPVVNVGPGAFVLWIRELSCRNPIAGTKSCAMMFSHWPGDSTECQVQITMGKSFKTIWIKCPNLSLE